MLMTVQSEMQVLALPVSCQSDKEPRYHNPGEEIKQLHFQVVVIPSRMQSQLSKLLGLSQAILTLAARLHAGVTVRQQYTVEVGYSNDTPCCQR